MSNRVPFLRLGVRRPGVVLLLASVAAISSPAQSLTVLHSFCAQNECSDGGNPQTELLEARDGTFYGANFFDGANGAGTIFRITRIGTLSTVYNFCSLPNCADGRDSSGLVQGNDGDFYGTTATGGNTNFCSGDGCGSIYKVTTGGVLTTLYSFTGADGVAPEAALLQSTDGNFYGTTYGGGLHNSGTVFRLTPDRVLTTLYSFCSQNQCMDGWAPHSALVRGRDGNFYGTTLYGGANSQAPFSGTVFKITPEGVHSVLYSFCSVGRCLDGGSPNGLVLGVDGNFYGTTSGGGTGSGCYLNGQYGCGTVFQITPAGVLTTLYSFTGSGPAAALVQATDENFYGTIAGHLALGYDGAIFKMTSHGVLSTLHTFSGSDGNDPEAALVQARDGNFYGTTFYGGDNNGGTVFRLSGAPGPNAVHSF